MKNLTIKIALSIVVVLSTFSLQSCKKDETKITPVQTPPASVNTSIIGKWKAITGTKTFEREFIKGNNANSGSGNFKLTQVDAFGTVTTVTGQFTWDINNTILHISQVADINFIFQITDNGTRLTLFDEFHTDRISFTFERIN